MEELDLADGVYTITAQSPQMGVAGVNGHAHQTTSPNGSKDVARGDVVVDVIGDASVQIHDSYQHQMIGERRNFIGDSDCTDVNLNDVTSDEYSVHCHVPRELSSNKARNQLAIVSVLCFLFMVAEIIGGVLSNSLALVTDAIHMASDLTGFLVSLAAIWIAKKQPTIRMSYGYYRTEVLGALISILIIWIATVVLVLFAVDRIRHPTYEIDADDMLIVAGLGVGFNVIMGLVLQSGLFKCCKVSHSHLGHGHSHSGHQELRESNESLQSLTDQSEPPKENINIRAAMIHVFGDLVQSIGVLIAAIIIKIEPAYKIADPICTFIFSILVLLTTIIVLRDVGLVILEGVPRGFDYKRLRGDLYQIQGVRAVHSLHVWSLTLNKIAGTVHLAIDDEGEWDKVLREGKSILQKKYNITQVTIQVEPYQDIMSSCEQCQSVDS